MLCLYPVARKSKRTKEEERGIKGVYIFEHPDIENLSLPWRPDGYKNLRATRMPKRCNPKEKDYKRVDRKSFIEVESGGPPSFVVFSNKKRWHGGGHVIIRGFVLSRWAGDSRRGVGAS